MSKPGKRPQRQKLSLSRPENLVDYQHKQAAITLLGLISLPLLVCLLAAYSHPEHRAMLLLASGVLILGAALFSSLKIEVKAQTLSWRFGLGLVHKQQSLSEVRSAEITKSTWLEGWGIHYTKRGWLYNVSGRDAILITLASGKSFMLGSDDVVALWEAIQYRIKD